MALRKNRGGFDWGVGVVVPHDLPLTYAWLGHLGGGSWNRSSFSRAMYPFRRTKRYLGCMQQLLEAVNDGSA